MKIKIALAQINTVLGDVQSNLRKHLSIARESQEAGVDLLIFPELSLTGYLLQDMVSTVALKLSPPDPVLRQMLEISQQMDCVFGFVEEDQRNRFYISSAYLSEGRILHIHRKVYLPTYSIFDEKRFFAPGRDIRAFDTRFGRIGLLVCEDFWHISTPYLLWMDGADLFVFIAASPGHGLGSDPHLGSSKTVHTTLSTYASLFTNFIFYTNRTGYEDGINFSGGAAVFDPNGQITLQGPEHEEALLQAEVDLDQLRRVRTRLPLLRDERPELVLDELSRILNKGKGVT
jgi:NAD+ synthase (glutamine-hydrolysing)